MLTLRHWDPILRLAMPVGVSLGGMQLLLSIDLWLLNAVGIGVPEADKGMYVAALNLARVPNLLSFVTFAVLMPSIAHALATDDRASAQRSARAAIRFLIALLVPGCALVAVHARELMALLFSAAYADGARLLMLLIFAQGLSYTMLNTLCGILIACNQQRAAAAITLGVLPAAVLANVVLIGLWGAVGAAVGALLDTVDGGSARGMVRRTGAWHVAAAISAGSNRPGRRSGRAARRADRDRGSRPPARACGARLGVRGADDRAGLLTREDLTSFLPALAKAR